MCTSPREFFIQFETSDKMGIPSNKHKTIKKKVINKLNYICTDNIRKKESMLLIICKYVYILEVVPEKC